MSMYGDDRYHSQMNDIYDEIERFLKKHPVSELLKIVSDVVEEREYQYTESEE